MPAPLSRKIRLVFTVQALVAALLVTFGTLVGASWLSERITADRMAQEVRNAWQLLERDPSQPLPQTTAWNSYFVPRGGEQDARLPAPLRGLAPGMHRLVFVDERAQGRLYVLAAPQMVDRAVRSMSMLAIGLSLLAIALVSWLGYRRCKRVVAPITRLSGQVGQWDPGRPAEHAFDEGGADAGEPSNEVRALREALRGMATRVSAHMRRESNFTRDASHEFRTPLTVIRMAADLLGHEDGLSSRGQRSLRRIGDASREMEDLLDALLLLARDASVPLEVEEVPVLDVVHEQIAVAEDQLGDKPVRIDLDVEELPRLHAPTRVLGVMLGHLLRNASAFTEAGRIAVRVRADRIVVSDTGIGMDADTLGHVFEPFWRADISRQGAKGMGLTIVQRLAERFGWRVELRSQPGSGTEAGIVFGDAHACGQAAARRVA